MAGFTILTVTQAATYLKSVLDSDRRLSGIYIRGEISDLRDHYGSGHIYFSLKDGAASLRAVMFQSYASRLRYRLTDGMAVIVRGDIAFYPKDGSCQLYAYDIQPDGTGAKYIAFEQLKERLEAEGLFSSEHKRVLPRYPMSIGVVTSDSGAALQDILRVLKRRWPMAEVIISPALVQGESAAEELTAALERLNAIGTPEVIIIGRGGGSADDLFAFNDERLVRTVYASRIPVVSAVGHETDYTLCDFAADLRAPTPSAAAELVSPDMSELRGYVAGVRPLLIAYMEKLIDRDRETLLSRREALLRAEAFYMRDARGRLVHKAELLESHSPLRLLASGYSAASVGGETLTSIKHVKPGDIIRIRLSDGVVNAAAVSTEGAL